MCTIKMPEQKEEQNICSYCDKDLEEAGLGYCDDCYSEISAVIAELASIKYQIDNCVKVGSDQDTLYDIKEQAKVLIEHIEELEAKAK